MKLSNVIVSPLKAELVTALQYHFYLHEYPPGTVATTPSGARTPHPIPDFGSSPGARTKKYKLRKLNFKIVREDTSIFKSKIQK